jgi:hypothetical protein
MVGVGASILLVTPSFESTLCYIFSVREQLFDHPPTFSDLDLKIFPTQNVIDNTKTKADGTI